MGSNEPIEPTITRALKMRSPNSLPWVVQWSFLSSDLAEYRPHFPVPKISCHHRHLFVRLPTLPKGENFLALLEKSDKNCITLCLLLTFLSLLHMKYLPLLSLQSFFWIFQSTVKIKEFVVRRFFRWSNWQEKKPSVVAGRNVAW